MLKLLLPALFLTLPAFGAQQQKKCVIDGSKKLCLGDKVSVDKQQLTITHARAFGEGTILLIEAEDKAGKSQELDPEALGFSTDCKKWSGHLLFADKVECIQRQEKVRQINANNCVTVKRGKICEGDIVWDTTNKDATIYKLDLYVHQIQVLDGKKLLRVSSDNERAMQFVDPATVGLTKGCVEDSEKKKFCVNDGVYFRRSVYPKEEAVIAAIYPDGTLRVIYWDNPGSASRTQKASLKIQSADYLTPRASNDLKFPYIY